MLRRALFTLAASLACLTPAAASSLDAPEAQFSWRLGFGGGHQLQPGYRLTVAYRDLQADAPTTELFALDVSGAAALARLAGLPLFGRAAYRSNQNEGGAVLSTTPWYARRWVLWTVGAAAASAALSGSGGGDEGSCAGTCNQENAGNFISSDGDGNVCVNDENCTPVPGGVVGLVGTPGASMSIDWERDRWLDAGTGHMGDLIAR